MAAIEWNDLYRATNRDNAPTPGYLFNDIVQNVSQAKPSDLPAVADYLADCVEGDHAHVKLKALFVIKTLAYRIPPFQQVMQEHLRCVQDAAVFTGPPSPMFGDEPYRLVREAADGALEALAGNEFYHEEYRLLSQRIVGFGNYEPPEDTKLPDGSVNVAKDVTFGDVLGGAVGGIFTGAGAIYSGVKGLFETHSRRVSGIGVEGMGIAEASAEQEECEEVYEEEVVEADEDEHPSNGTYVPPIVPAAPTEPELEEERQDQLHQEACFAAAQSLLDAEEPSFPDLIDPEAAD